MTARAGGRAWGPRRSAAPLVAVATLALLLVSSLAPAGAGTPNVSRALVPGPSGRGASVPMVVSSPPSPLPGTAPRSDGLTISSFVVQPSTSVVGEPVTFTVQVRNGSASIAFAYAGLPPGCPSVNSSAFSCAPILSGPYAIEVTVTDPASGGTARATTNLTVVAPFDLLQASATPSALDVLATTTVASLVTGGQAPYTFSYSGLPLGCVSADSASLACTPIASGTYVVHVHASDALGQSGLANVTLRVNPPIAIVSFAATPGVADAGETVDFLINYTGGTAPVSVAYSGLPLNCSPAALLVTCTPSAGTFNATVNLTDASGQTVTGRTQLHVNPAPTVTLAAYPLTLRQGGSLILTAAIAGGTPPYTFDYLGLPLGCPQLNAAEVHCIPARAGTFSATLNVTDALGISASASVLIAVTANASTPAGSGGTPVVDYVVLGAVAIAAVAAVVLFARRPK
jgi:hypothetical protein